MISVTVDDREVRQGLERLARAVGDIQPALHDIGQALIERSREGILGGEGWGGGFAANTATTLERKSGNAPLIDSRSFVRTRLHYHADRNGVTIGASGAQAAVLQFGAAKGAFGRTRRGAPIPWGDIPARPYLPLDGGALHPDAAELVLEILQEHLSGDF